jgi:hypothetical protein
MKKIIFIISLLFTLFKTNISISQQTYQWQFVDTAGIELGFHSTISTQPLAYRNVNNILILGFNKSYAWRYSSHDSLKIDSATGEKYDYTLLKYSDKAEKSEVIFTDTTNHDYHWRSMDYPSEELIIVVGDTVEYLGYLEDKYKKKTEYKTYGMIWISRDDGKHWTQRKTDSNVYFKRLFMFDSLNGIIMQVETDNYYNRKQVKNTSLLTTDDCWQTYNIIALPNEFSGILECVNETFWVITCKDEVNDKHYLNITKDKGKSWVKSSYFERGVSVDVKFIDEKIGYAFGKKTLNYHYEIPVYLKSTDGGITWFTLQYKKDHPLFPFVAKSFSFFDEMNGICNNAEKIIRTTNGGITWLDEQTPSLYFDDERDNSNYTLVDVIWPSENFILGIFINKYIIKYENKKVLKMPEFYRIPNWFYRPIDDFRIKWTSVEGAKKYHFKYDHSLIDSLQASFYDPDVDTILTDTSMSIQNLNYGRQYNLWIKAIGDSIESDWNEKTKYFLTLPREGDVPPPGLIKPEPKSIFLTNRVTFIWEEVQNVDTTFFELTGYQNFEEYHYEIETVEERLTLTDIVPSTQYELKLRSKKNGKYSHTLFYIFYSDITLSSDDKIDLSKSKNLIIYPNPVFNNCKLKINSNGYRSVFINVHNILGNKIISNNTRLIEGENIIPIKTENLAPGFYFVESIIGTDVQRGMFLKE